MTSSYESVHTKEQNPSSTRRLQSEIRIKIKASVYNLVIHYYACSSDFTFLLAKWTLEQLYAPGTITARWAEAVWIMKFAQHFYTLPAVEIEPQTF